MQIKQAVTRVVPFATGPLYLQSETPEAKARLTALHATQRGRFAVSVVLDYDAPTGLLDATLALRACRALKAATLVWEPGATGVRFVGAEGSFAVPIVLGPAQSGVPETPMALLKPVEGWAEIQQVVHVASFADDDRPELSLIRAGQASTEAATEECLARVARGFGDGQFLESAALAKWPKGEVRAFLDHTWAWFEIGGEEYRTIEVSQGHWPPLAELLPEVYTRSLFAVSRKALLAHVKAAMIASPLKVVSLRLDGNFLEIGSHGDQIAYVGRLALTEPPARKAATLLLGGKLLVAALSAIAAPTIKLSIVSASDPLRIESGKLTEAIYPLASLTR